MQCPLALVAPLTYSLIFVRTGELTRQTGWKIVPHGPSVNTLRLCYLRVPTLFGIGYPFYNVLSFREISNVSVKKMSIRANRLYVV